MVRDTNMTLADQGKDALISAVWVQSEIFANGRMMAGVYRRSLNQLFSEANAEQLDAFAKHIVANR